MPRASPYLRLTFSRHLNRCLALNTSLYAISSYHSQFRPSSGTLHVFAYGDSVLRVGPNKGHVSIEVYEQKQALQLKPQEGAAVIQAGLALCPKVLL